MQAEGAAAAIGRAAPASCIAHVERLPGRPAEYAVPRGPLPTPLEDWLAVKGSVSIPIRCGRSTRSARAATS